MSGKDASADEPRASTPKPTTPLPKINREIDASKLKRLIEYAPKCGKCETFKNLLTKDYKSSKDAKLFMHTLDNHLVTKHPRKKRLMEPPVATKLYIRSKKAKDKSDGAETDTETDNLDSTIQNMSDTSVTSVKNSEASFVSEYTADSAKTPRKIDIEKSAERPAKKPANEFGHSELRISRESVAAMDTDSSNINEVSKIRSPLREIDLNLYISNNSPTEEHINVPVNNRFEPLSNLNTEEPSTSNTASNAAGKPKPAETPTRPPTKHTTPPPIVIVGQDNGNLADALDKVTSGNFWLKNTANTIVLHTQNMPDYQAAIRMLNNNNFHYHTYSSGGKKTHAFVLRGLSQNHTEDRILNFIKSNSTVDIQKVFKMRTIGAPLFLVITGASWTIAKLKKELPHVLRTAVQWENRRSNNPITQCRRCQTWGHSMANCTRTVRCSKCAGRHFIHECTHQGPPTCANCKQEHRSFSRQCPVYESKLSQYLEKFPSAKAAKPAYVPAPLPANPAWSPRTQQVMQNRQASQQQQSGPATLDPKQYNVNFPNAPGQRRGQNQPQTPAQQSQPAPAAPSARSMGQFNALKSKWDEINKLINYDNMLRALDIYISLLRSAHSNDELFNASREFFCNVLPTISLAP